MPTFQYVATTGNADIDGVLSGYRWASGNITYSFPTSSSQYEFAVPGFQALNSAQKIAAEKALTNFAAVAQLNFTEVVGGYGTIRFAESSDPETAYAYYPDDEDYYPWGGDVFFNKSDYNTPSVGTYAYQTFLHELGHALGLDHGQDGELGALPKNHDSLEYSVMTYRSYVGAKMNGYTNAAGSFPSTLMLSDIAALQHMYGANYDTNSGDTVYTWSASTGSFAINDEFQHKSTTNKIFMTIWDGGGNDTYDFSNYTSNLNINLGPGEWSITSSSQLAKLSSSKSARGNIANAWMHEDNPASLIENAIGGTGKDLIVGNLASNRLDGGEGNDSLKGLGGSDIIIGGGGTDTCYFEFASTSCIVTYDSSAMSYLVVSLDDVDTIYSTEFFAFTDKLVTAGIISADDPLLVSATPGDGGTGVRDDANIVLTFDKDVVAGTGQIVIKRSDGTVFQTFDMSTVPSQVTFDGNTVTIDPTGYFKAKTGYYVTITRDAILDEDGNSFSGMMGSGDFNFTAESNVYRGTSSSQTINGSSSGDRMFGMGGNDTISGGSGNDTIDGGTGKDSMSGGSGNDQYYVDNSSDRVKEDSGKGTDKVFASASFTLASNIEQLELTGTADITGKGNSSSNTITGNIGANVLKGEGGNDTILGGDGADTIYGGSGNDSLTGGSGADSFVFNTTLSASSNIDTITDFAVAHDSIVLARSVFAALPLGALSDAAFALSTDGDAASANIVYNASTGALSYDKDGAGSAAAVQFALLGTGLALTYEHFSIV